MPALEKDAKLADKTINVLSRFGASLTRNAALTGAVSAPDTGV